MCVLDLNDRKTLKGVLFNILIEDSHDFSVSLQLSGGCELTVVLHDFSAGCSTELSVCTGEGKKITLIAFIILFFSKLSCKPKPDQYTALACRPDGRTARTAE